MSISSCVKFILLPVVWASAFIISYKSMAGDCILYLAEESMGLNEIFSAVELQILLTSTYSS